MKITTRNQLASIATCFFIAGAVFLSGGCSHTVYGPRANRSTAQALSFKPPPGQSGIYVIRQSGFVGAAVAWTILLDIDQLGMVTMDHYLYATVPPGDHNLTMTVQTNNGLIFHTEPDKNYFYTVNPSLGGGDFHLLSEDQGRQLVTDQSSRK